MKFALVSWSKGEDKDALSIVPVQWIVDFDPADFTKEYLVECRSTGKRPTNEWQVEDAHVLQLAEKESTLRTAEQKLLQVDTPTNKKRKRVPNKLFTDTQEKTVGQVSKKKNYKLMAARQSELEVLSQEELELSPVNTAKETATEEIRALREENRRLRDQQSEGSAAIKNLETQVKALEMDNIMLHKIAIKEIPSLLAAVKTLISDKITESSTSESELENEAHPALPSAPQLTSPKPASVQLGNDSSIRVSAHCWESAKAQPTAKGMAHVLLLGLFNIDVLLRSKINPSADRRQPLDPKKLKALLDAVGQQHPGVKIADLRTSINKIMCELRHQEKKKSMDN